MDHIDQAIKDIVHESSIKAKDIAARTGMGHQVLLSKANPNNDTHKLTLKEAVAIQLVTGSNSIYRAMGIELGVDSEDARSGGVLESLIMLAKTNNDAFSDIHEAMADGVLTNSENSHCQRKLDDLDKEIAVMRATLQAKMNSEPSLRTIGAN